MALALTKTIIILSPAKMNTSDGIGLIDHDTAAAAAAPQLTSSAVIQSCVLAVMSLASVYGNIWTIRNIQKSRVAKKLHLQNFTAIYSLITHLSVADLLVALFCMVGNAVWRLTVQFLAGDVM